MSETKITLTVDELFSDILSRMNINRNDISSFQGEDSDEISKTFKYEYEDIFDVDKFRFISECNMAKKNNRNFWKYVDETQYKINQIKQYLSFWNVYYESIQGIRERI